MQALQRFHESNVLAAKISEVFRPKVRSCKKENRYFCLDETTPVQSKKKVRWMRAEHYSR